MKRIAIIGGGISGLTVLHYLKQRLGESVAVTLFEREASVGGTIRSLKKDSCLFEWGPNGFLDNQDASLQLTQELGLSSQLIEAKASAHQRYIQINDELLAVPTNPIDFIRTPLLPFKDKWSLISGIFKKNISKDLSIHNYVSQRFSVRVAENLIDPLISGIYAGNIKNLHMSAFPKLKRRGRRMRSFKEGMGQLIEALDQRYKGHIQTNSEVSCAQVKSDIIIVAAPAYAASKIVENMNPVLADLLAKVPYAPVAVAGLLFDKDSFKKKPEGFGYLIPSHANKNILGVLIESNVFAHRAGEDQTMMRVLLGGAHHPAIINDDQNQILASAVKEIDHIYGLMSNPIEAFVKLWPKAIAQYDIDYPRWRQAIGEQCAKTPGLYLCANYLDGVSFNECINNAKSLARTIKV